MHLLLADDHSLFREGLHLLLAQLDADARVSEASNFDAALACALEEADLDLVLLDLNMPGMNGAKGVERFRASLPNLPVVVISASTAAEDMRGILDAGAVGYIPKSSSSQVMLSALRLVLAGGVYVPPDVLRAPVQAAESAHRAPREHVLLTDRQIAVLRLIVQGKPNKGIARELNLSEGTVKIHLASIYRALNALNRTEAAMAAQRLGLLSD